MLHFWQWCYSILYWQSLVHILYVFLYRENRYLLFLTENYAALQVLKRYLQEAVGLPAPSRVPAGGAGGLEGPSVEEEREQQRKRVQQRKMEPFVLFGSSFPKDMVYTQVWLKK